MVVERGTERGGVAVEIAGEDRVGGEAGRGEGLVHAVAGERVDEAGGVADEQHSSAGGDGCAEAAHRQPMAAHLADRVGRDVVVGGETAEMVAQGGALVSPAADAEVRVVPLREHPAVAAGRLPELDDGGALVALRVDRAPGDVSLERDAVDDLRCQSGLACDDAVRSVRADEHAGDDGCPVDGGRDGVLALGDAGDAHAVVDVGAGRSGLLEQVVVEPAALRHQDQRALGGALELASVPETQAEAVDDVLDDGRHVAGSLAERAPGEAAAARLVAGEAGAVDEQHARPAAGEPDRGRRPRRTGADDERVVLHGAIVGRGTPDPMHGPDRAAAAGRREAGYAPGAQRSARLTPPTRSCGRVGRGNSALARAPDQSGRRDASRRGGRLRRPGAAAVGGVREEEGGLSPSLSPVHRLPSRRRWETGPGAAARRAGPTSAAPVRISPAPRRTRRRLR